MTNFEVDTDSEPDTDSDDSSTFIPVCDISIGTEFYSIILDTRFSSPKIPWGL